MMTDKPVSDHTETREATTVPVSDTKPIAARYFEHIGLEDEMEDALLSACGIDPNKPDEWPLDDFTFDYYDESFEFRGVKPEWSMTPEQKAACLALGFDRFWICYTDGTESYCGGERKVVTHPRGSGQCAYWRRKAELLSAQLARLQPGAVVLRDDKEEERKNMLGTVPVPHRTETRD